MQTMETASGDVAGATSTQLTPQQMARAEKNRCVLFSFFLSRRGVGVGVHAFLIRNLTKTTCRKRRELALVRKRLCVLNKSDQMHEMLCEHIFRWLPNDSLVKARSMSRDWRSAVAETAKSYRRFSLGDTAPSAEAICAPIPPHPGLGAASTSDTAPAPVSVVASAATDGNVSEGGNGTAPCLLRVARWVDGALSTQYSSAVRTMPARREGKRRKAEKLLARHLSNTSSELLLRWRHVDKDNVEDEDDDRPAATSFLEVTTTPPTPSRV